MNEELRKELEGLQKELIETTERALKEKKEWEQKEAEERKLMEELRKEILFRALRLKCRQMSASASSKVGISIKDIQQEIGIIANEEDLEEFEESTGIKLEGIVGGYKFCWKTEPR